MHAARAGVGDRFEHRNIHVTNADTNNITVYSPSPIRRRANSHAQGEAGMGRFHSAAARVDDPSEFPAAGKRVGRGAERSARVLTETRQSETIPAPDSRREFFRENEQSSEARYRGKIRNLPTHPTNPEPRLPAWNPAFIELVWILKTSAVAHTGRLLAGIGTR